jgi:hypothetical protein
VEGRAIQTPTSSIPFHGCRPIIVSSYREGNPNTSKRSNRAHHTYVKRKRERKRERERERLGLQSDQTSQSTHRLIVPSPVDQDLPFLIRVNAVNLGDIVPLSSARGLDRDLQ